MRLAASVDRLRRDTGTSVSCCSAWRALRTKRSWLPSGTLYPFFDYGFPYKTKPTQKKRALITIWLLGYQEVPSEVRSNVALLISLHAFTRDAEIGDVSDWLGLMPEPPRPGAKRRARLRATAAALFVQLREKQREQEKTSEAGSVHEKEDGSTLFPSKLSSDPRLLEAVLAAVPLNAFGLGPDGQDGQCLAPTAAYVNHSCLPNCVLVL